MFTRLITFAALLLGASIAQASNQQCKAEDSCPITLTEPFIQSPEECQNEEGFTVSYEYILQNNTFTDVEIDIYLDPDTDEVDINEDESSCFDFGSSSSPITMSAQESCTIIIDIFIEDCETTPPPYTITDQLVIIPHGVNQGPIESDIEVEVIQGGFLTVTPGFTSGDLLAKPYASDSIDIPLLAAFTANGEWENIDTSVFGGGVFASATCTGNDDDGICIAVGSNFNPLKTTDEELFFDTYIFSSQDGGQSWAPQATPVDLSAIELLSVACSNDGDDSAFCMAVGTEGIDKIHQAVALSSTDGGINWTFENLGLDSPNSYLVDVDCTDENNADGFCVAVGNDSADGLIITIPFSGAKAKTQIIPLTPTPKDAGDIYYATACTGTGEDDVDTVCTVVGYNVFNGDASLFISVNGSPFINWDTEISGTFIDTACTTAVSGNIVCTAVGVEFDNDDSMLYVNKNVAADPDNWQRVNTAENAQLVGTACETNNIETVCVAVGDNFSGLSKVVADEFETFLYVNTDVTALISPWDLIDTPVAAFNGAACTLTAAHNIACTVAGIDESNEPIIFFTPDIDDIDWDIPTVTGGLPADGCFFGAEASGNSSNLDFCPQFPLPVTLSGPEPEVPPLRSAMINPKALFIP